MARSDRTHTTVDAYLRLLGTSSLDAFAGNVTARIREALQLHGATGVPVRLSVSARDFGIRPEPDYDPAVRDGELVYSQESGSFLIRLNQKYRGATWLLTGDDVEGIETFERLGRGRFNYAHEFGHRFFYVRAGSTWKRAQILAVARETDPEKRLHDLHTLHGIEERACDNIAGELLVPTDILASRVGSSLKGEQASGVSDIHQVAVRVSREFKVSYECALVRLERAIRHRAIPCTSCACALLIVWSDRKGTPNRKCSGRSRPDFRIRVAIIPDELDGKPIRRVFTGMAVSNLGDSVRGVVQDAVEMMRVGHGDGRIDLPLLLKFKASSLDCVVRLRGYWRSLSRQQAGDWQDYRVLLCGMIEPAGVFGNNQR